MRELQHVDWITEVQQWASKKKVPSLADAFVEFFRLAFQPITYPQQAFFGVHADRVSLCVGNIWLAALRSPPEGLYMLVDAVVERDWCSSEPVKSTMRYVPLYWLGAKPLAQVEHVVRSTAVWASYAKACLKVLESPISRNNIPKNQINKVPLSVLLARADNHPPPRPETPPKNDQSEFEEGGIRQVTLELRQRNPQLRKQAIAKYGHRCQVCGCSFEELYGDLGAGCIEVHHLKPLSSRVQKYTTSVGEVAVVCANCHRVLHRVGGEPMPIRELQSIVEQQRRNQKAH